MNGLFRLAHETGQSLASVLNMDLDPLGRRLTHRLYLSWVEWLDMQWNIPTRDNYYMMRVAQRIIQAAVKEPDEIDIYDQRVEFGDGKKKESTEESKAEIVGWEKAVWLGRVGGVARAPGQDNLPPDAPGRTDLVMTKEEHNPCPQ